jgi:hypothetical protein
VQERRIEGTFKHLLIKKLEVRKKDTLINNKRYINKKDTLINKRFGINAFWPLGPVNIIDRNILILQSDTISNLYFRRKQV